MNTAGKIAIAALTGAAAGVLTGILVAPQSGKETRKAIRTKAGKISSSIANAKDDLLLNFMILKERFAEASHELADDVKDAVKKEIDAIESSLSKGSKKSKAVMNGSAN